MFFAMTAEEKLLNLIRKKNPVDQPPPVKKEEKKVLSQSKPDIQLNKGVDLLSFLNKGVPVIAIKQALGNVFCISILKVPC